MPEKDTEALFSELKGDSDIKDFLARNKDEFIRPLHKYLSELLAMKNMSKRDIIHETKIDRAYVYHIFSGTKENPSRHKLFAITMAMKLSLPETQ